MASHSGLQTAQFSCQPNIDACVDYNRTVGGVIRCPESATDRLLPHVGLDILGNEALLAIRKGGRRKAGICNKSACPKRSLSTFTGARYVGKPLRQTETEACAKADVRWPALAPVIEQFLESRRSSPNRDMNRDLVTVPTSASNATPMQAAAPTCSYAFPNRALRHSEVCRTSLHDYRDGDGRARA